MAEAPQTGEQPGRCETRLSTGPYVVTCDKGAGHEPPHYATGYGSWTNVPLPSIPEGNPDA